MSLLEQLLDLDITATQISNGVNAVTLMTTCLDHTMNPYIDGFDAICDYLLTASQTLQAQLDACLNTMRQDSFC